MLSLESLQKKIKTVEDLLSVVKTMKSLAALNIRHYEAAAGALEDYNRIVDMGWQVLFRRKTPISLPTAKSGRQAVCLVIGSDQGMCGQFNEAVLTLADAGQSLDLHNKIFFWAAGERVRTGLADVERIYEYFDLPGSIAGINDRVQEIVRTFAEWQSERSMETMFVVYNKLTGRAGYRSVREQLLPLDQDWSARFREKSWPTACLPLAGLPAAELVGHLFRQYLFAALYRAFAHSMAGENAARLAAMQAAEKNILELEEELKAGFRETRQNTITAELLDIVAGFEAVGGKKQIRIKS